MKCCVIAISLSYSTNIKYSIQTRIWKFYLLLAQKTVTNENAKCIALALPEFRFALMKKDKITYKIIKNRKCCHKIWRAKSIPFQPWYRIMLNMKRNDRVSNTIIHAITSAKPLVQCVRKPLLGFFGHALRLPKVGLARKCALYMPSHGKRRPGRSRKSHLANIQ